MHRMPDYQDNHIVFIMVKTISSFILGLTVALGVGTAFAQFPVTSVYEGGTGTSTAPSTGEVLVGQSDGTYAPQATSTLGISGGGGSGTVTSVAASVPSGWTIAGSPITTSGTLAFDYDTGFAAVRTASTTNWNNFYNTPSTRITAGTGLSWAANTLNAEVQTSDLHNAVTITGEDFLSLATQQITANAINPDNLAAADFGDFTCNGTTCSLDATYLTDMNWGDAVDADIIPDVDSTRDIGTSTVRFAEGHFDTVHTFDWRANDSELYMTQAGGEYLLYLLGTGNAVNYFQMDNASTGFDPILNVVGTDTDINLNLKPKGTGELQRNGQHVIDESMLSTGLTYSGGSVTVDLGTSIDTSEITNGTIINEDISASAAIDYSKLTLTNQILEADLKAVDTPVDEECLTYESTTGDFEWQTCATGGGDAWSDPVDADIVPDADGTRDVGSSVNRFAEGHFDAVHSQNWVSNDNEAVFKDVNNLSITTYSSYVGAVNSIWFQNATTTNPVFIGALGSDTNIGLDLVPKGSGEAQVNGQEIIDESMLGTGLTYSAGTVSVDLGTAIELGGSEVTGTLDISDHTNLVGGTGITLTGDTLSADLGTSISSAEIEADTITHANIADSDQATTICLSRIENPTAADDFESIWANKTTNDFLLTGIWAESDQTVNFDLQVDDGTPADVNGTDISPAAGEAEDTSLSGDTTLAAGEELDLVITSVANTPTWVSICWTGNWVD